MIVNSYLELHTTLLAWTLYGIIWDVFLILGLVGLPVAWLLLKTGVLSLGRFQEGHEDMSTLIKQVAGVALVVLFFLVPTWPVNPTDVQYQPPPDSSGHHPPAVNPVSTPTTFGLSFTAAPVRIPTGWYLLYAFSQGMTRAVIDGLPDQASIRDLQTIIQSRNITDPALGAEYGDFVNGCYIPAMANYEKLSSPGIIASAPEDQPLWPGHEHLVTTPGLYGHCPAGQAGDLCRADAPRPLNIQQDQTLVSRVGGDSCADWWRYLRPRLLDHAAQDQGAIDRGKDVLFRIFGADPRAQEDAMIRAMLQNHQKRGVISGTAEGVGVGQMVTGGLGDLVKGVGDTIMTGIAGYEWLKLEFLVILLKQVIPMVLAMLLLALVVVSPFALLFSACQVGTVVKLSFWMFSLIFMHALIALAGWLDNILLTAMFAGEGHFDFLDQIQAKESVLQKKFLVNMALIANYLLFPMLWFTVMGSVAGGLASGANSLLSSGTRTGGGNISKMPKVPKMPKMSNPGTSAGPGNSTAKTYRF